MVDQLGPTGPYQERDVGRRQASLGTLVPSTPTVAPGPKARAELASGRSLVEDGVPRAPRTAGQASA